MASILDAMNVPAFLFKFAPRTSSAAPHLRVRFLLRLTQPRSSRSERLTRSGAFCKLPHFLDGEAVKLDSEGGVHPGEVLGFVDLGCTLLNVLFAVPHIERYF